MKLHRTGSRRILHVENHKEETRKAFSEMSGDLFSQTPTQEVSDVNMVISKTLENHQIHHKAMILPGLCNLLFGVIATLLAHQKHL